MGTVNFDALPKENPYGLIPKGFYKGVVKKTEVKTDDKGQDYLMVVFNVFTAAGINVGTFTEYIRNSEAPIVLFKLGRMLLSMNINLTGAVELRVLAKVIVPGKEVAMELDENTYQGKTKSQIKVFDSLCFWPVSMLPGLVAADATPAAPTVAAAPAPVAADSTVYPFDASDGVTPPVVAAPAQPVIATEHAAGTEY